MIATSTLSSGAETPSSTTPSSAHDLPGHYYLSGVMEVGSELLLEPGGEFQWVLFYGGVDQMAQGHWTSDGKAVTLISKTADGGLKFQLGERTKWNDHATHSLEQREEQMARDTRLRECPLTTISREEIANLMDAAPADKIPTAADMEKLRAVSVQKGEAAQAALDRLKAHPGWQKDEALVEDANKALSDFQDSRDMLLGAYSIAKVKEESPVTLNLPKECRVADWEKKAANFRGVAIHVFDPQYSVSAHGIPVSAVYDQGPPANDIVKNGYAFFPLPEGRRIVSITLHVAHNAGTKEGSAKDTTLPVSITEPSLQLIDADFSAEISSGFKQMVLTINPDGSLTPEGQLSRGKYSKAGQTEPEQTKPEQTKPARKAPISTEKPARVAAGKAKRLCEAVLSAATACALETSCTAETPMYLSSADRSAVIAMDQRPGFSRSAFDRYCIQACNSHSSEIEEQAFTRDVCGIRKHAGTASPALKLE